MISFGYALNLSDGNVRSKDEEEEMDLSNQTFINEIWYIAEASEIIIKTFAFLPIVLLGIFGNLALIYVICKYRHLRSPTNLLVGNMALSDLLSLLIQPEFFLVNDLFQNYQFGEIGCKTEGAIECALLLTSVMNLSAISYDRLTAIVLPQETRLTRKGAKIVMAITWIAGIVIASPLYFYRDYKERVWLDFVEKYCSEDTVVINIYWHVIITMMVWLPLIIMSICYMSIFIKLDRYEKRVQKHCKVVGMVKYKTKVAKTIFIVVVTFIICHLPFTALIFYRNQLLKNNLISEQNDVRNQVNGTYQVLWFLSRFFIVVNAAVNPIIYGLTNEKFCRVFKVTPLIKWIFVSEHKKIIRSDERKKPTKETSIDSNNKGQNKLFTIYKLRSPFTGKNNKKERVVNTADKQNN